MPSLRLWWMWPEQPGNFWLHLAMKLGMTPKRLPISLAPVLNRIDAVGLLQRVG